MKFYILEDDQAVVSNLEDIIERNGLGTVCGDSGDEHIIVQDIIAADPDIILVDFLMPEKDGISIVKELRAEGCTAKCVMISQMSTKELISKAYDAGVDFFISKPINMIEIRSILNSIKENINNARTLEDIKRLFVNMQMGTKADPEAQTQARIRKMQNILNQIGMSGEKGSEDILKICSYLFENSIKINDIRITELCERLSDNPKNTEQRIRRAIAQGMAAIANLGLEDFSNETFTRYSGTIFPFEEVRAEMSYISGKKERGGKISTKKFIESLIVFTE